MKDAPDYAVGCRFSAFKIIERSEFIASGGSVIGGTPVCSAARQISVARVGVRIFHLLPHVSWNNHKRTDAAQRIRSGLFYRDGNRAVVHNGVMVDQEAVSRSQRVGYRRVFPEIVYGKGDILCRQRRTVVEFCIGKQGKRIVTAVHFPGLGKPWNISSSSSIRLANTRFILALPGPRDAFK